MPSQSPGRRKNGDLAKGGKGRHALHYLWIFCGLILWSGPAHGEGNTAPPLDFPSEVPERRRPEFCRQQPCSPGCRQQVTCDDYDRSRDRCANADQKLVDWQCDQPCSCASDGVVICSVSYRCTDGNEEVGRRPEFQKPKIELAIPLSVGLPVRE